MQSAFTVVPKLSFAFHVDVRQELTKLSKRLYPLYVVCTTRALRRLRLRHHQRLFLLCQQYCYNVHLFVHPNNKRTRVHLDSRCHCR